MHPRHALLLPLALGTLLAVAVVPRGYAAEAAPAPARHWQVDVGGFAGSGAGMAGTFAGGGVNASFFPSDRRLGMRFQGTFGACGDWEGDVMLVRFAGAPAVTALTTSTSLDFVGIGPEWRVPLRSAEARFYALWGGATLRTQSDAGSDWLTYTPFPIVSSQTQAVALGALVRSPQKTLPWIGRGMSAALGGDLLAGGAVTYLRHPPTEPDTSGVAVAKFARRGLLVFTIRFELTKSFPPLSPPAKKRGR